MKKILSLILSTIIIVCLMNISTSATENDYSPKIINEKIEYFPDGSSVVITISEKSTPTTFTTTYSKAGSKTYTLRNSSGDILWKFIVNGTFSVNPGVSTTCTSVSYSTSNVANGWNLKSASTSKSDNKAIGTATFQYKILFVVTDTKSCTVTLTCDVNGNLS